jgi:hypothetical protein
VNKVRTPREAGMLPFYFLFRLPQGADEGLLILQRFSNFGIRRILAYDLNGYFSKFYPDYLIQLNPLIAPEVWKTYLSDGRILNIRFVKFGVPTDLADQLPADHVEDVRSVSQRPSSNSDPRAGPDRGQDVLLGRQGSLDRRR